MLLIPTDSGYIVEHDFDTNDIKNESNETHNELNGISTSTMNYIRSRTKGGFPLYRSRVHARLSTRIYV